MVCMCCVEHEQPCDFSLGRELLDRRRPLIFHDRRESFQVDHQLIFLFFVFVMFRFLEKRNFSRLREQMCVSQTLLRVDVIITLTKLHNKGFWIKPVSMCCALTFYFRIQPFRQHITSKPTKKSSMRALLPKKNNVCVCLCVCVAKSRVM